MHGALGNILQTRDMGKYDDGTGRTDVVMKSSLTDKFDKWQMLNSYVKIDGKDIRVAELMDINRREATKCIHKENQEYVLWRSTCSAPTPTRPTT